MKHAPLHSYVQEANRRPPEGGRRKAVVSIVDTEAMKTGRQLSCLVNGMSVPVAIRRDQILSVAPHLADEDLAVELL